MSWCTLADLKARVRRHLPAPSVFVETGTFEGDGVEKALPFFDEIHTIEISPLLHAHATGRFLSQPRVHCHLGDSTKLLPLFTRRFQRPVWWSLDAHWFPTRGDKAGGQDGFALETELRLLTMRDLADVIEVDDVQCFGSDYLGPEWKKWSVDRVIDLFPNAREAVVFVGDEDGRQLLIYR